MPIYSVKKWTKSIAVGSKGFAESVKSLLGAISGRRKVREVSEAYQLREPSALYGDHFGVKNDDMGVAPIFGVLSLNNQWDNMTRPHYPPCPVKS